jgi:hypothetical protein
MVSLGFVLNSIMFGLSFCMIIAIAFTGEPATWLLPAVLVLFLSVGIANRFHWVRRNQEVQSVTLSHQLEKLRVVAVVPAPSCPAGDAAIESYHNIIARVTEDSRHIHRPLNDGPVNDAPCITCGAHAGEKHQTWCKHY